MLKALLTLVVIGLTVYAAVDAWNAEAEDHRGLPRGLWLILILVLPGFGALAWFALSSTTRRARAGRAPGRGPVPRSSGGHGPAPRGSSGPVAPDDDPEFLWRLEQERRRAAREGRTRQEPPAQPRGHSEDAAADAADPASPPDSPDTQDS